MLYVGKAKSLRRRIASYTRLAGHTNRIARMIALTATMVFASTRTEVEALLLEANLIKQLKPRFNVLMRDDKSFPYILLTSGRARRAADQASRRAQPQGRLFRPLRQRLGGQQHAQRAAARLPAALLRKLLLRQSHAALPAVPDQALRRALHGEVSTEDYDELVARGARFPHRQIPRGARAARGRDERGGGNARIRTRRAAARPHFRAGRDPGRSRASIRAASRRPTSSPSHEEAGQFCIEAVFYRAFQNWGNRAYFPRADRTLSPGRGARGLSSRSFMPTGRRRAASCSRTRSTRRDCWRRRSPNSAATRSRSLGRSAAKKAKWSPTPRKTPARRWAGASPTAPASRSCWRRWPRLSAWTKPPRRVEVYDNSHIMGTARSAPWSSRGRRAS